MGIRMLYRLISRDVILLSYHSMIWARIVQIRHNLIDWDNRVIEPFHSEGVLFICRAITAFTSESSGFIDYFHISICKYLAGNGLSFNAVPTIFLWHARQ